MTMINLKALIVGFFTVVVVIILLSIKIRDRLNRKKKPSNAKRLGHRKSKDFRVIKERKEKSARKFKKKNR